MPKAASCSSPGRSTRRALSGGSRNGGEKGWRRGNRKIVTQRGCHSEIVTTEMERIPVIKGYGIQRRAGAPLVGGDRRLEFPCRTIKGRRCNRSRRSLGAWNRRFCRVATVQIISPRSRIRLMFHAMTTSNSFQPSARCPIICYESRTMTLRCISIRCISRPAVDYLEPSR